MMLLLWLDAVSFHYREVRGMPRISSVELIEISNVIVPHWLRCVTTGVVLLQLEAQRDSIENDQ
jgi:hypothetical protein